MWIIGSETVIEHCTHCTPRFWWIENEPDKAPQFAYSGFPADGQVVLSKNRAIVLCRKCTRGYEEIQHALEQAVS